MAVDGFFNKICSLKHLFKIAKSTPLSLLWEQKLLAVAILE